MARLIGTAGHVDHGKTTLIKALTGIDADRLPEEKARGMTIDIGFAYVDLPGVGRVSIVDVPGHERFLTNMLVGALGIDVALLCVASDEGVKPQTREHLQILDLLPVQKLVVAMTRCDLADEETLELAKLEVADLLAGTRFEECPTLAVSAVTGQGIEQLRVELVKALSDADQERPKGLWYLPIDRAFTVKGHGCVVTGTLARGGVRVGDSAVVSPGGRETRIRAIHSHDEELPSVEPGRRAALNLGNVKAEDVHRGQTVGAPGAIFETQCLDAEVRWVNECKHAERVRISIGAAEAIGRIFLDPLDKQHVQLRAMTPLAVALDQPVIVRKHSPPTLLCGGKVTVPIAKPRQKSVRAEMSQSPAEQILAVAQASPWGVETSEVCRQLGRTPQELGSDFEALQESGRILGFAGLWFSSDIWSGCEAKLLETLRGLHVQHPAHPWHARDTVVKASGFSWTGKPLDRIVSHLAGIGKLEAQGTGIRLPGFKVQLTERQRAFLDRVKLELEQYEVTTPNDHELAQRLRVPIQAVEEMLKVGQLAGEIVNLEGGVTYTVGQIEAIQSRLRAEFGEKRFGAGEARDALGASRKYIIPLLEHLDKLGFTLRVGDQRAIRKANGS